MPRRVLITGGARGIGAAIAARYRSAGYEVATPGRSHLDLASLESVGAFISYGASVDVDVLVNNAGKNHPLPIAYLTLESWQRTLTVNLTSAMLLVRACAGRMAERRWGRIVNVSSIYAPLARAGRAAYSASKAGLDAVTRTAALEYGERNVLVNSVLPGFVDTELTRKNNPPAKIEELRRQTAVQRLADPTEIAEAVFFLGSEANSFVTGQTLIADGGFSIQ